AGLGEVRPAAAADPGAPAAMVAPAPAAEARAALLVHQAASGERQSVTIRQDGDANLLVEYGPMILDLALRFRVQALLQVLERWRAAGRLPCIIDLTRGIRSLHVPFDDDQLPREQLLAALARAEDELPVTDD